jgi:hypothetical protein
MTPQEIRLFAVLGHVAIAIIALVVTLAAVSIARFVQTQRIARARTLPSLRGDARADAGHLVDHRQAIRGLGSSSCGAPFSGRLKC